MTMNQKPIKQLIISKKTVLIDEEDYATVAPYKWYLNSYKHTKSRYAICITHSLSMHRLIMNAPKGMDVDHINGNTLDNRKCNLRIVSRSVNLLNSRRRKTNKSGYKNISVEHTSKTNMYYRVTVNIKGKQHRLGRFKSLEEAVSIRNAFYKKHGLLVKD